MQESRTECPRCGLAQPAAAEECAGCGVVFSKLKQRATAEPAAAQGGPPPPTVHLEDDDPGPLRRLWAAAWSPPDDVNPFEVWARAALWLGLLVLGWSYVTAPIERSQMATSFVHFVLSRVNLVFHEAGHLVFGMLGRFVSTLGGSLMQVLVPLVCAGAFLRHRNAFAASAALWWTGQSLIDLAPYVHDARAQRMILLGGVTGRDAPGYHDWHYLLRSLNMLSSDHALARFVHFTGALLVLVALAWGGRLLLQQHRALRGE